MKQAKVLTDAERKRLLAVIANDRHSERNRRKDDSGWSSICIDARDKNNHGLEFGISGVYQK